MSWADFKIAIAKGLVASAESVANIISGATKVGNADKLDDYHVEKVGQSGARNLIPYPYFETTHTESGVTWTDNGDGTITVNGTANSTSTNGSYFIAIDTRKVNFPVGTYTLSTNIASSSCRMFIRFANSSGVTVAENWIPSTGKSATFEVLDDYSTYKISIMVSNGTSVSNLLFMPMLESGPIAHEWKPYHFAGAEYALNADTLDGKHASDFLFSQNFIAGNMGTKCVYYTATMNKDCNDIDNFLSVAIGADGLHYPTANVFYYILTLKYDDNAKKQIAFDYGGNRMFTRYCKSGTWYDWIADINTGNSVPVIVSKTAPTDTTAAWIVPN